MTPGTLSLVGTSITLAMWIGERPGISVPSARRVGVPAVASRSTWASSIVRPTRTGVVMACAGGWVVVVVEDGGGVGNVASSMPRWAASMTSFQMSAGYVPPKTLRSVVGGTIGIWPTG